MKFFALVLSYLTYRIRHGFKTLWRRIGYRLWPHFLSLPSELLLEILKQLDYRTLINARQTCKVLYEMTSSEQFWANLARELCTKPGIGRLPYPPGNYSGVGLMHWTLRRLRARDRWASENSKLPLQLRSRIIEGGFALWGSTLLRGGRWLFVVGERGAVHILDLDEELPQFQFLFTTYRSEVDLLTEFRIWVDEGKSGLSFRVATYSHISNSKNKTRICIQQIDIEGSSIVTTPIAILHDYPRASTRTSAALCEKFFIQAFKLHKEHEDITVTSLDIVLQLRRYSGESKQSVMKYVEIQVEIETRGPNSVFFLPGSRVGLVAPDFINIYAIGPNQDPSLPELVLLHHAPTFLSAQFLSTPFVGSQRTYLVGVYKHIFKRISIDHNPDFPPIVQNIGNLEPLLRRVPPTVRFGPSASVVYRTSTSLHFVTYEHRVDQDCFRVRKHTMLPDDSSLVPRTLAGFDDLTGRIVFETNAQNLLLVYDLV